jgi:hypothetical protein
MPSLPFVPPSNPDHDDADAALDSIGELALALKEANAALLAILEETAKPNGSVDAISAIASATLALTGTR